MRDILTTPYTQRTRNTPIKTAAKVPASQLSQCWENIDPQGLICEEETRYLGFKTGGTKMAGNLTGLYKDRNGQTTMYKQGGTPGETLAEFIASQIYQATMPENTAICTLGRPKNEEQGLENVYLGSRYAAGHNRSPLDDEFTAGEQQGRGHQLLGLTAPEIVQRFGEGCDENSKDPRNHVNFRKVLAHALLLGDLDIHLGNMMLNDADGIACVKKIDHGFSLFDFAGEIPNVFALAHRLPIRLHNGRLKKLPTNHFWEWGAYAPTYLSQKFIDELEEVVRNETKTIIRKTFETALNAAMNIYKPVDQLQALKSLAVHMGISDRALLDETDCTRLKKRLLISFNIHLVRRVKSIQALQADIKRRIANKPSEEERKATTLNRINKDALLLLERLLPPTEYDALINGLKIIKGNMAYTTKQSKINEQSALINSKIGEYLEKNPHNKALIRLNDRIFNTRDIFSRVAAKKVVIKMAQDCLQDQITIQHQDSALPKSFAHQKKELAKLEKSLAQGDPRALSYSKFEKKVQSILTPSIAKRFKWAVKSFFSRMADDFGWTSTPEESTTSASQWRNSQWMAVAGDGYAMVSPPFSESNLGEGSSSGAREARHTTPVPSLRPETGIQSIVPPSPLVATAAGGSPLQLQQGSSSPAPVNPVYYAYPVVTTTSASNRAAAAEVVLVDANNDANKRQLKPATPTSTTQIAVM